MPAGVAYLALPQLSQTLDISVDLSADGRLRTVYAKSARALCWRACVAALPVVLLGGRRLRRPATIQGATCWCDKPVPQGLRSVCRFSTGPATIFIRPARKVVYVHTSQYDSQGTLDQDVSSYALSG